MLESISISQHIRKRKNRLLGVAEHSLKALHININSDPMTKKKNVFVEIDKRTKFPSATDFRQAI